MGRKECFAIKEPLRKRKPIRRGHRRSHYGNHIQWYRHLVVAERGGCQNNMQGQQGTIAIGMEFVTIPAFSIALGDFPGADQSFL